MLKHINQGSSLKTIISFDDPTPELTTLAEEKGVNLKYYHVMISEYKENYTLYKSSENKLDSIFTISYTSGTSGNSKGVMLTNANFLSAFTNIL